jgi:hypothetical protein
MKRVLFLSIFLLAGVYSFAQIQELEENRPPMFDYPKYKNWSWGQYLTVFSNGIHTSAYAFCGAERLFIEFTLTRNQDIKLISFSENIPENIKISLQKSILESKQYWKPKKIKGKLKDSKICLIWVVGKINCMGDTLKRKETEERFKVLLSEKKDENLKKAFSPNIKSLII